MVPLDVQIMRSLKGDTPRHSTDIQRQPSVPPEHCDFGDGKPSREQAILVNEMRLMREPSEYTVMCENVQFMSMPDPAAAPCEMEHPKKGAKFHRNGEPVYYKNADGTTTAFIQVHEVDTKNEDGTVTINAKSVDGGRWLPMTAPDGTQQVERVGGTLYPVCGTTDQQIGEREGIGLLLFLQTFKVLAVAMVFLAILAGYSWYLNRDGDALDSSDPAYFVARHSWGNMNATVDGQERSADENAQVYVQYAVLIGWLIVIRVLRHYHRQSTIEFDTDNVTASDYALLVKDLPANTRSDDLIAHFTKLANQVTKDNHSDLGSEGADAEKDAEKGKTAASEEHLVKGMTIALYDVRAVVETYQQVSVSSVHSLIGYVHASL